jgi:hypothetical protein
VIELDFMVPPQVSVGRGPSGDGHPVDVVVTASPEVFPDHDDFVQVSLVRGKVQLANRIRIQKNSTSIDIALIEMGTTVGRELDREMDRKNRLMKSLTKPESV